MGVIDRLSDLADEAKERSMNSYMFDIGEKARVVSRFIGEVRAQLQMAFIEEKTTKKLTQQQLATMIGTDRSVINRQLMGYENITLRRVAEFAWAFGWEIHFELRKPRTDSASATSAPSQWTPEELEQLAALKDRPHIVYNRIATSHDKAR